MDRKLCLVLVLSVTSIFPALSIINWQSNPIVYDEAGVITLALNYLNISPTFVFDGIPESVQVTDISSGRTPVPNWVIMIDFDCSHPGFGDRVNADVLEVITSHTISIKVSQGVVVSALIDGKWDTVNQIFIEGQEPDEYTQETSVEAALKFLEDSPTFQFDGIPESVIVDIVIPYRMRWTYGVTINFTCSHAGYGDRTDMILAQVLTDNQARIIVEKNTVIGAFIDNYWDMMKHRETVQSELLPPEMAKDIAIEYLLERYSQISAPLPEFWAFEILDLEGSVGSSIQQFTGGDWAVNVSFAVVARPDYQVSVKYTGETNFTWSGTVDQNTAVSEKSTSLEVVILSPADARDIAVAYFIEVDSLNVTAPEDWMTENLTPQDLVGFNKMQYTSGEWVVNVSNPVVWKPTYNVDVEYSFVGYVWSGRVDQSGTVVSEMLE